ncbi:sensor histidine kinase [Sulfurimonas aquatica]|uniref:histidine kinase n=2 Tax=Sulfurimonas aquatica TaxID=2672570 RepID=A0A975GDX8_9BACT|nr:sensor histidine kinase [Sulfurimonas aquatica]
MLVTKILLYTTESFDLKNSKYNELLEKTINEFEQNEVILKKIGYVFELKDKKRYIEHAKKLLTTPSRIEIDSLENEYQKLSESINNFVLSIQRKSEESTHKIENLETLILILLLILLLVEAFFIFLPAEKEIKSKNNSLLAINKDLDKKVKIQSAHMLQQSRLAQMGEMISMIAHQWRQPLSSISAITGTLSLDIMMDQYKKEFFQERLESISSLSQYLSSTIDDFRDFFKVKQEAQETTLQEIVDSSLEIMAPIFDLKKISIEKESLHPNVKLNTYINEIRQVVLNIINNAADAILKEQILSPKIWISSYKNDNYAILSIEDNAGGIPKECVLKIFDPYFSTKCEKDGTGLGLYMSKTIIEEHCKGKLSVSNTENGAKFIIQLPL